MSARARAGGREALVIARREVLERVRSKWFVIGTLLGPIAMLAVILVPALLAAREEKVVKIALVLRAAAEVAPAPGPAPAPTPAGAAEPTAAKPAASAPSAALAKELIAGFALVGWRAHVVTDLEESALLEQVREQEINGFLVVPADVLGGGAVTYQGDNGTSAPAMARLERVVTTVVQHRRGIAVGITDEQVLRMLAPVLITTKHTTGEAAGASGMATFIVGYVVMFILYLAIILYASNVMRSVVQEKTSRVVELMVAAVKPRALMAGKILGVGAVGLLQLAVWLGMGFLTLKYRDALLGLLDITKTGGVSVPPLSLSQVAVVLIYFILGYFLYAALYAAVGAMVSSEQEAQQAQMPVMTLIIIAIACVQLVANDPRGQSAVVLTVIPFFSPLLMPMRYLLGGAGAVDLAVSIGVLLVTLAVVVVASGRIYRVGILMVGKRPSARELWRWLRY
ncbi:MAG: ABC transporter permease [Myxococcales bacterium]|nr:ABC transporter permease [Myxococcales bacterium]